MALGKKTGGGSRKGIPNKSTDMARQAIARFVEDNSEMFQKWLDEIYAEHGAKDAFNCVKDLIEYHVPKLTRQDINATVGGDSENPLVVVLPSKNEE